MIDMLGKWRWVSRTYAVDSPVNPIRSDPGQRHLCIVAQLSSIIHLNSLLFYSGLIRLLRLMDDARRDVLGDPLQRLEIEA